MQQVEEFRESFELFDDDNSGAIDTNELATLMKAFGQDLDDEQLQEMVNEVDVTGTGVIEFDEFVKMIVLRMEKAMMDDDKQVRKAFDVFDEEGNGHITTASLQKALGKRTGKSVTLSEAQKMIKAADKDGDGTVDFQE